MPWAADLPLCGSSSSALLQESPNILREPGTSKGAVCNVGDMGSIPGLGRSPGERKGYPLQYSGLENPIDRGAGGLQSVDRTESDTTEATKHALP